VQPLSGGRVSWTLEIPLNTHGLFFRKVACSGYDVTSKMLVDSLPGFLINYKPEVTFMELSQRKICKNAQTGLAMSVSPALNRFSWNLIFSGTGIGQFVLWLGYCVDRPRDRGLIPGAEQRLSLFRIVQTSSEAHQTSYSVCTVTLSPVVKRCGLKLYLHSPIHLNGCWRS
jgi:hypothetical protein